MTGPIHECPAEGCRARLPFHILMCRTHWSLVSRGTRAQVMATWRGLRAGTATPDEYEHARDTAIREATPTPTETP